MGNSLRDGASTKFVARYRQLDGTPQSVMEHLDGVSFLAAAFAGKIDLPSLGEVMGLLHDLGKYSDAFQKYIKSSQGKRGEVDHSTAGAQYAWEHRGTSLYQQITAEIITLCTASHHSGLIDCLAPDGADVLGKRLAKPEHRAHTDEVKAKVDAAIRRRIDGLLSSPAIDHELRGRLERLSGDEPSMEVGRFRLGFLTRFLFSALIDADRLNSAERNPNPKPDWSSLIEALEVHLAGFMAGKEIDDIRARISSSCLDFAARDKGIYQLTVPTGGGKTLASLRFALSHAARHGMDRVIYVVPYTSIIDQNARVACSVFSVIEEAGNQVVLEHHSNLTPERDTEENQLLAENWDAPIVYTTAVQFLETLFASGTRGVRRLHQLANAVIIFDEIQTIPIKTVHLFNNAVNFLASQCSSTIVFCTATQPLLDKVDPEKGAAQLSADSQMICDVAGLFGELRRAKIEDQCKPGGWTIDEVADTALKLLHEAGSVLIVVNKKAQARDLYLQLRDETNNVCHLSTSMCPAHRIEVLGEIRNCLDPKNRSPVVCVSTQLIEAGVDVDFDSAIRYLAGLDSIAQTAGRCNRNRLRTIGQVLIVNPCEENLDKLPEIRKAQEATLRVLGEYHSDPAMFDCDLQSPKAMERYYSYYFHERKHEMVFPVSAKEIDRDDDLLSLLSANALSVEAYKNALHQAPPYCLRQSFMAAGKTFKAIDSETEGVIVPYGEDGHRLIQELCSASEFENRLNLLKMAQRYSVNLYPYQLRKFKEQDCLYETWEGSGIFFLDERHYSGDFGVSEQEAAQMGVLIDGGRYS